MPHHDRLFSLQGYPAMPDASAVGSGVEESRSRVHLMLPGAPESLPQIRQTVVGAAMRMGFAEHDIDKIEMAVGEACTNVIEHAYRVQPLKNEIEVLVTSFDNRLEVVILDYSASNFPVDERDIVALDEYIGTQRKRGLGLYIIRNFVDDVEHRFINGRGNELRLTKFLA